MNIFISNKASVAVLVIVAVIVLTAIVGGSYLIVKKAIEKRDQVEQSAAEEKFEGWKTHKSEELGVEFKYPADWEINKKACRYSPSEGDINCLEIEPQIKRVQGKDSEGNDIVKPGIVIYESKVDYEVEKEDLNLSITGDFQEIIIDTVSGVKKFGEITEHISPFGDKKIVIILNKKDAPLLFRASPYDDEILNQVLSTFKFLEPDEFADWKTYRNEEYEWEVKYPGEWASQEPQGFSGSLVLDAVNFNKSDIKDIEIRTDNITIKVISKESIEELIPIWFSRVEKERDEKKKLNEINWHLVYYKEGVYKKGISALTEYAGKIYEIGFSSPNEANFLEKSNIFNQILSTFKFLEPDETPEGVVENFYNWYLGPHEKYEKIFDLLKGSGYIDEESLESITAKPVICAQEFPNTRTYDKAVISDDNATVIAHHIYSISGDNPIIVGLKLINGEWKISSITCWRTYRNEEYGWEVQYPDKARLVDRGYEWGKLVIFPHEVSFALSDVNVDDLVFYIRAYNNEQKLSPKSWAAEVTKRSNIFQQKEINFAGKVAYEFILNGVVNTRPDSDGGRIFDNTMKFVYVANDNFILRISYPVTEIQAHADGFDPIERKIIFDQILSTFKFLE